MVVSGIVLESVQIHVINKVTGSIVSISPFSPHHSV